MRVSLWRYEYTRRYTNLQVPTWPLLLYTWPLLLSNALAKRRKVCDEQNIIPNNFMMM